MSILKFPLIRMTVDDEPVARGSKQAPTQPNPKAKAYGFKEAAGLAWLFPDKAVKNADSYALFASVKGPLALSRVFELTDLPRHYGSKSSTFRFQKMINLAVQCLWTPRLVSQVHRTILAQRLSLFLSHSLSGLRLKFLSRSP